MKTTRTPLVANLYNPHEQNKTQLIERFIVRRHVFQELFRDIKSSDMTTPECPYLIEGQRGMGKTTILLRLSYAIENDPDLSTWLIPIVLKEEAYYGIRHLFSLWKMIAQELEGKNPAFYGLSRQMNDDHNGLPTSTASMANYEQTCFEMLVSALQKRSKKIILCIDNLGQMLRNFSDQENLRFRDILATCPHIRLIGASAIVFDAIQRGNLVLVFQNFFHIIRLEGLTRSETHTLFLALAQASHNEKAFQIMNAEHPGRIEALRILTGGVIRSLILLFEVFTGSQNGNSINDLDEILDRVTPLYQSRMNDLTPLQRDVVNAIALSWDAVSSEDIARVTYMPIADISVALNELEKLLIVQQMITEDQQHFYQLKERFFNIWYLMRLAPGEGRSKVLWLLHFLESWYDQRELIRQAKKHTEALVAKRYSPDSAYYLTEALARTGQLDMDTEHQMIQATHTLLQDYDAHLTAKLPVSDKEIFDKAEEHYQNGDYDNATSLYLQMKQKNDRVYVRLGNAFSKLTAYDRAIHYLAKAVENKHLEATLQLARLYHTTLKDYKAAETYYLMAVKQDSIEAMLALGHLHYRRIKNYQKAEEYYLMTIKEGRKRSMLTASEKFSLNALKQFLLPNSKNNNSAPLQPTDGKDAALIKKQYVQDIKTISAEAMFQLGNLYANELNMYEKARAFYSAAIKTGCTEAIVHLALFYHYRLQDYKKAIKFYSIALKKGELRYAAVNLGILYQNILKDYANAERYYLLAAKKGHAGAMNGLAWVYFEQKQHKQQALQYAKQASDKEKTMYTAHTLACIYLWNNQAEEAVLVAQEFMYDTESYTAINQDILLYLMLLLAKQQYHHLTEYFEAPELNLQERFKPLYYAFLYHIHDPDYYKRPPELIEPIGGIIGQVQRLAASYS